ncbi:MAG: hypothetical protein JRG80_17725 [Deltaproteobacteria bacterium]|nr:hypothetical protein [Deltaproteobacteria bacterium]
MPTDLMDMNLADLMSMKVDRRSPDADAELSWVDPSRFHLAYRYVRFTFDGYRDGTDNVSDDDLIGPPNGVTYPILQDKIVQQAHTFAAAYDITRRASAHLMIPYIRQMTEHHGIAGGPDFGKFTIESDGIGDISLIGSFRALDIDRHSLVANAGLSFPSGSITKKGDTPMPGKRNQLPYTMQLGSGSYDVILSAGYQGSSASLGSTKVAMLGSIGWGAQILGKIRTGKNDRGYRLGHRLLISTWLSAQPFTWLEPFLKLDTQIWGRIRGNDDDFPGPTFPTPVADPDNFGGEKLALTGGVTLRPPKLPEGRFYQALSRQAVTIEYGQPVYESLNGPQPRERWRLSIDWSIGF